jgi:hypothetical protein
VDSVHWILIALALGQVLTASALARFAYLRARDRADAAQAALADANRALRTAEFLEAQVAINTYQHRELNALRANSVAHACLLIALVERDGGEVVQEVMH